MLFRSVSQSRYIENQGVKKVFLCIGYKGNLIRSFVKKIEDKLNLKIIFSEESEKNLLGTGGAIKKILSKLGNYFYIMKGSHVRLSRNYSASRHQSRHQRHEVSADSKQFCSQ